MSIHLVVVHRLVYRPVFRNEEEGTGVLEAVMQRVPVLVLRHIQVRVLQTVGESPVAPVLPPGRIRPIGNARCGRVELQDMIIIAEDGHDGAIAVRPIRGADEPGVLLRCGVALLASDKSRDAHGKDGKNPFHNDVELSYT